VAPGARVARAVREATARGVATAARDGAGGAGDAAHEERLAAAERLRALREDVAEGADPAGELARALGDLEAARRELGAVREKAQACGLFSLETLGDVYAERREGLEAQEYALCERVRMLRRRAGAGGGAG